MEKIQLLSLLLKLYTQLVMLNPLDLFQLNIPNNYGVPSAPQFYNNWSIPDNIANYQQSTIQHIQQPSLNNQPINPFTGKSYFTSPLSDVVNDFTKSLRQQSNTFNTQIGLQMAQTPGLEGYGIATATEGITDTMDDAKGVTNDIKDSFHVNEGTPEKLSGLDKFNNSFIGRNAKTVGKALDIAGSMLTDSKMYEGPYGNLASGMQQGWDMVSDQVMNIPGFGTAAGLIMKGANVLNKGANKVLGDKAIDNMTVQDTILNNPALGWNVGLINALAGSNAQTITKDAMLQSEIGSDYTKTFSDIDKATEKSGKRFGFVSQKELAKANSEIEEAKRKQNIITDINDLASTRFAVRDSMAHINGNRRGFQMRGGYNQAAVSFGQRGLKVQTSFEKFKATLPKNLQNDDEFRLEDYWKFNGEPKDFQEAVDKGIFTKEKDGWHAYSVAENPETGEIEFMKSSKHPTHYKEVEWYNSKDGAKFRSEYELVRTEPYWKYVKRPKATNFKDGGELINSVIKEIYFPSIIKEISFKQYFKDGGKFNVIPDGALHARLHHMDDADNLTKKGIPVVSEDEEGNLEQQAEIERDEIIFRISVTEQLEKLAKIFNSDESKQQEKNEAAIEAGKLLVEEILNNTQDNTNLINTI